MSRRLRLPASKPLRALLLVGSALVLCACAFVGSALVVAVQNERAEHRSARTASAAPTPTPLPTVAPTVTRTPRLTATPVPTATPIPSPTVPPTVTPAPTTAPPPAPTDSPEPTRAPNLTVAALLTQSASSPTPAPATNTPALTAPPAVKYLPLFGHLFDGVKVYYGAARTYGFEVVGGSENCPAMPSGRGVLVRYQDGSTEWKDRMYLIESEIFFVRSDDPNRSSFLWTERGGCQ